jgi:hypothetical protein
MRHSGVAVTRIVLDGMPIALGDVRFTTGWHAPETTPRCSTHPDILTER